MGEGADLLLGSQRRAMVENGHGEDCAERLATRGLACARGYVGRATD